MARIQSFDGNPMGGEMNKSETRKISLRHLLFTGVCSRTNLCRCFAFRRKGPKLLIVQSPTYAKASAKRQRLNAITCLPDGGISGVGFFYCGVPVGVATATNFVTLPAFRPGVLLQS